MSGSVEERLQRALAQQAESTTTSPEGWQRVRTAIDGGEGRRRRLSLPWLALAPDLRLPCCCWVRNVELLLVQFALRPAASSRGADCSAKIRRHSD